MAKVDDHSGTSGWKELPQPRPAPVLSRRRNPFQQLSLGHIMLALIYFAIVFWSGRQVLETNSVIQQVILLLLVGLGICALGLWAVLKFSRYSFIGWGIFILGNLVISLGMTTGFHIPDWSDWSIWPIFIAIIIYLGLLTAAIINLILRKRVTNQDALLWVLTVAADRGMPLAPGILAFSHQVRGNFASLTESLAELLRRGVALAEAANSLPQVFPWDAALLIRVGSESGNLAKGLRTAVDSRARHRFIVRSIRSRLLYLGWVLLASVFISGFIMYYIQPRFEAIFKDFGIELPEVTRMMIRTSQIIIDYLWVPLLVFCGVGVSWIIKFLSGDSFRLPGFDRLFARRHKILILRALALTIEADRPIPATLQMLGQWYPIRWIRTKLRDTAADVSQGADWIESLNANGLISLVDAGVLASAQRAGNLPWALRELAETTERRWGYRLQAIAQVGFVLAMLLVGCLVGLLAVAYFAPLTTLISRLTQ